MYGLARYLGIGPTVTLGGREFVVHARRIRDYATIDARMLQLRGNPFDNLRWIAGPGDDRDSAARAFNKLRDGWWDVTFGEMLHFLNSWEGRLLGLSLAIGETERRVRGEVGYALRRATAWECERFWEPFQETIDTANGDDELGSLDWIGKESDGGSSEPVSWPATFRDLAEAPFHLSHSEIAEMTLGQLRTLRGSRSALKKAPTFTRLTESQAWQAKQMEVANQAAGNLADQKLWGVK